MDSWYKKLAKSGWLGSGVQASEEADERLKRGADGMMDYSTAPEAYGQALKNLKNKKPDNEG